MKNANKKIIIIWIDKNIRNKENKSYLTQLGFFNIQIDDCSDSSSYSNIHIPIEKEKSNFENDVHPYDNITEALNFLKKIKFESTIIIISGNYFIDFVTQFYNELKFIYVIPKIIIFTSIKRNYVLPEEILNNERFYKYGGIKTSFNEIEEFINKIKNEIIDNTQQRPLTKAIIGERFIFDQVKSKKDLLLPAFYKALLDKSNFHDNNEFIKYLYDNYINELNYKNILNQIINVPDIPVELLSKYYARIYTIEGNFYKNMKMDLLLNSNEHFKTYMPFIKTLYEGLEKGALKHMIVVNFIVLNFFLKKKSMI